MASQYRSRKSHVVDLPLATDIGAFGIEEVILRFNDESTIDIGARCFLKRSNAHRRNPSLPDKVIHSSLCGDRAMRVRTLVSNASQVIRSGRLKGNTMYAYVRQWVVFFDWCDANEYNTALESVIPARFAFRQFSETLRDRVGRSELSPNTAALCQAAILTMYRDYLMFEGVDEGVRRLNTSTRSVVSTLVPPEDHQVRILALCEALFDSISRFLIGGHEYPFRIKVPDYLSFPDDCFWAFPTTRWFMAPHELRNRESQRSPYWAYDYENGQVASEVDIAFRYRTSDKAIRAIAGATTAIRNANGDPHHPRRMCLAKFAMNAFQVLFLASTGMNHSQLKSLRWSDDFEIGRRSQGFREVKARAGGRAVAFHIGTKFVGPFKKFVQLRSFFLEKADVTDRLFFRADALAPYTTSALGNSPPGAFFKVLRKLDPALVAITSRQWRACKSDWLIRNTDISTAALVLQSSERTVAQFYLSGSETQAANELGDFFARLPLILQRNDDGGAKSTAQNFIGACTSIGNPAPESGATRTPDCRQPEGCLFCENYRIHADVTDVRKLVSCRFCIGKTSHLSDSIEHFDSLFGPVLARIELLLSEIASISQHNAAMVEKVVAEVEEEGELDDYWGRKLNSLVYLGVVSP